MSRQTSGSTARRRAEAPQRRPDPTVVVAGLVLLLATGLTALVGSNADRSGAQQPEETPLTRASVVCPSGSERAVFGASGGSGESEVGLDGPTEPIALGGNRTVSGGSRGEAVVLTGTGEVSSGLLAGRFESPLAAAECGAPQADQWFTGVGAGARHRSVVGLVNPDGGRAIVDVTVYGRNGVVVADDLRGLAVAGRSEMQVDLPTTIPRREDLTLRVTANRGRIAASLLDGFDRIGSGTDPEEWLPAQAEPLTSQLLLGLPEGRRTLVLSNPGTSETRAALRLVTEDAVLTPENAEDITVPPESTVTVPANRVLSGPAADGAIGLVVDSEAPVTATLRSLGGDLSHSVSAPAVGERSSVLLPDGDKQVLLGGASGAGTVALVARDAAGDVLARQRVEVTAGAGYVVEVPEAARRLDVTPERATIAASVVVSGDGQTVVRLREPERTQRVPAVRPGLPSS